MGSDSDNTIDWNIWDWDNIHYDADKFRHNMMETANLLARPDKEQSFIDYKSFWMSLSL